MTGGDTMVNVLKELGATGIEMIDYVIRKPIWCGLLAVIMPG